MQMSKSNKIIFTLLLTFVISVCIAFGNMFMPRVSAETDSGIHPEDLVAFSKDITEKEFADNAIVATVKNDSSIEIRNQLVISDLELEFDIPQGMKVTVVVTAGSYYVNGNKKVADDKTTFDKEIETEIEVVGTADKEVLAIGVKDNFVTANGSKVEQDAYYKISNVAGISVGKIAFVVKADEQVTGQFKLYSVDQKASSDSDNYKQTFEISGKALKTVATPRVVVDTSFYTQTEKGVYVAKRMVSTGGNYESVTAKVYAVSKTAKDSDVYLAAEDVKGASDNAMVALESGTKTPKKVAFIKEGDVELDLVVNDVVCDKVTVKVLAKDAENDVPYYVYDAQAIEAFNAELKLMYTDEEGKSIALGSDLSIPSMEDFVFDDVTPYNKLAVNTYYKSRIENVVTELKININEPGEYKFCVAFADQSGNAMETEDFVYTDSETQEVKYGKYADAEQVGDFVFSFIINDDADLVVKPALKQGTGYVGVKYEASKFIIDASGCTLSYQLYYNADDQATEDSAGWVEIPKASLITDKDYDKDGFDYDLIQSIGYDGKIAFTPHKTGSFMLVCTATSDISPRTSTAKSVIKVQEKKAEVNPPVIDDAWIKNNTLSLVFLGIGAACLVAVVVLLFIKPKEDK